jgi:hypothetical protein
MGSPNHSTSYSFLSIGGVSAMTAASTIDKIFGQRLELEVDELRILGVKREKQHSGKAVEESPIQDKSRPNQNRLQFCQLG